MGRKEQDPEQQEGLGKVVETRDRRSFTFSVYDEKAVRHGDYVQVDFQKEGEDLVLLGQVELIVGEGIKVGTETMSGTVGLIGIGAEVVRTKDIEQTYVRATARILAFIDSNQKVNSLDPTINYLNCPVKSAEKVNLDKVFSNIGNPDIAPLEVGYLLNHKQPVVASLDPTGFMRHTAVFGQSGSGKSFSFAIVLEELLLKTEARILVIDPNSDYREFRTLRSRSSIIRGSRRSYDRDQHEKLEREWSRLREDFLFFTLEPGSSERALRLKFGELGEREQASLLGLDPVTNREEYNVFRETREGLESGHYGVEDFVQLLSKSISVEKIRLLYHIQNLGIDRMKIWGEPTALQTLGHENWRFACLDVRSCDPLDRSIIVASVLSQIYEENVRDRRVTFLVIDEAHNFCPTEPWYQHQNETKRIITEIAGEGRKYGTFLMLLSQNPSKISEHVLFQCDNVILMRMTSGLEVRSLASVLSDVSVELAQNAFTLDKGQAICMGGIVRAPTVMQFDLRKTSPGGDDLSKEWARKRFQE